MAQRNLKRARAGALGGGEGEGAGPAPAAHPGRHLHLPNYETVALMLTPRKVASSIASTPALVAGIFTIILGARLLKSTACSTNAFALRHKRGSV